MRDQAAYMKKWRAGKIKDDPFRLRDHRYLDWIRRKPCLICGMPSDAHHLQHAQPRSLGRKTGDQYAVPVCRRHHDEIHGRGIPERTWWALQGINPIIWAERAYKEWTNEHD